MNIYKQKIKDHYADPKHAGKLENFTHTAKVSNLACGDEITIYLKVENDKIIEISHDTEGCALIIATASILSEYLLNKSISAISLLNKEEIEKLIEFEVGISRESCILMPLEAVKTAFQE